MKPRVSISDGILSELRECARRQRRPFREILEETIQRSLSVMPPSPGKQLTIQTHCVGIKPACQGQSLTRASPPLA